MNYLNKFIFASLLAVAAVFAQGRSAHFGVHVGLGMAGLNHPSSAEEAVDSDSKLVGTIGGIYSMQLSESVNLDPEALLSYAGMPGKKSTDIRLDIPGIFKFYTLDYLFLQAGPQMSLSFYYADDDGNNHKARKLLDIGPVVGLGYQIDANTTIDVRYYYGITKYFDDSIDYLSPNAQSFQVFLGYTYLF